MEQTLRTPFDDDDRLVASSLRKLGRDVPEQGSDAFEFDRYVLRENYLRHHLFKYTMAAARRARLILKTMECSDGGGKMAEPAPLVKIDWRDFTPSNPRQQTAATNRALPWTRLHIESQPELSVLSQMEWQWSDWFTFDKYVRELRDELGVHWEHFLRSAELSKGFIRIAEEIEREEEAL